MKQEDILEKVLNLWREIEKKQNEINVLVLKNREEVKQDPDFEDDYTESIESYYSQ